MEAVRAVLDGRRTPWSGIPLYPGLRDPCWPGIRFQDGGERERERRYTLAIQTKPGLVQSEKCTRSTRYQYSLTGQLVRMRMCGCVCACVCARVGKSAILCYAIFWILGASRRGGGACVCVCACVQGRKGVISGSGSEGNGNPDQRTAR